MAKGDEDAPEPDMEISKAIAGLLGWVLQIHMSDRQYCCQNRRYSCRRPRH